MPNPYIDKSKDFDQSQNPSPPWSFLGYTPQQLNLLGLNIFGKTGLAFITHPIYRASILQVNSATEPKPLTQIEAFKKMYAEGGIKAFGKGVAPGVTREAMKTTIKAPIQFALTQYAVMWFPESSTARAIFIGVGSGTIPSAILAPLEGYKIWKMSQQGTPSFTQYVQLMWEAQAEKTGFSEKVKGFVNTTYRGYTKTAVKETMMNGSMFLTMPLANTIVAPFKEKYPTGSKIASASLSGSVVAFIVSLLDIAKNADQKEIGKKKKFTETVKELYRQASLQSNSKAQTLRQVAKRLFCGVPAKASLTLISYSFAAYLMGRLMDTVKSDPPSSLPPPSQPPKPSDDILPPPKSLLTGYERDRQQSKLIQAAPQADVDDLAVTFKQLEITRRVRVMG